MTNVQCHVQHLQCIHINSFQLVLVVKNVREKDASERSEQTGQGLKAPKAHLYLICLNLQILIETLTPQMIRKITLT